MALRFNWAVIQSLENDFLQIINDKLAALEKPDFIGDIVVKEASFGNRVPDVEILDIRLKDEPQPSAASYTNTNTATNTSTNTNTKPSTNTNTTHQQSGPRSPETLLTPTKVVEKGIQTTVRVLYTGDARLKVSTELRINKPFPNFIIFPLTLGVFNFSFNGQIELTYCQDNVEIVCNTLLGPGSVGPDILDFRVEAELGDTNEAAPQGIHNIETFVLQQLKRILTSKLTIPIRKAPLQVGGRAEPLYKIGQA